MAGPLAGMTRIQWEDFSRGEPSFTGISPDFKTNGRSAIDAQFIGLTGGRRRQQQRERAPRAVLLKMVRVAHFKHARF